MITDTQPFDNLPGVRLRRLADRYRDLKQRIAVLAGEANEIRDTVSKMVDVGHYESCSVYKVSKVVVRRHTRKGYKAIRARYQV